MYINIHCCLQTNKKAKEGYVLKWSGLTQRCLVLIRVQGNKHTAEKK